MEDVIRFVVVESALVKYQATLNQVLRFSLVNFHIKPAVILQSHQYILGVVNGKLETLRDGETIAFFSARPRLFEFLNCETLKRLCEKIESARHTELLKKRDCETREIRLKFCETCNF